MKGAARYGTRRLWREATCLRCRKKFFGRVNPALVDEHGTVLRGERMAERLCRPCRTDDNRQEAETGAEVGGLTSLGRRYVGRSASATCVDDDWILPGGA